MTLKEQIMKLQTYKMFEGEDTVYVERDDVLKLLEQQTCEDAISKHAVLETIDNRIEQIKRDADAINKSYSHLSFAEGVYDGYCRLKCDLWDLPSVTPKFTDTEIQKMQELEQAQLDKAYELGKAEMQPCEDCISRKDVMAIIEWAYDECKIDGYTDYCEMCDMVRGLPSVKPQGGEDCISRQAVIDIIDFEDKWLHDASGHNANTKIAFSGIKSRVKALLSVTSEAESEK